jgi:serine/threonine protein kinase
LATYQDETVAVKEIFHDSADPLYSYQMKKVEEELRAHQQLSHPKIVTFIDAEICQGKVSIITKYQRKGSVHAFIKKNGPLSEKLACLVAREVLEGLVHIHTQKIIHRDIKASNLLIGDDNSIKITDFGVSVQRPQSSTDCVNSHYHNGSLQWMAPELFFEENYNQQVDTWSLGCTIIEVITGKAPFVEVYPDIYSFYLQCDNYDEVKFVIPKTYQVKWKKKRRTITLSEDLHEFLKAIMVVDWQKRPTCREIFENMERYPWLLRSSPIMD